MTPELEPTTEALSPRRADKEAAIVAAAAEEFRSVGFAAAKLDAIANIERNITDRKPPAEARRPRASPRSGCPPSPRRNQTRDRRTRRLPIQTRFPPPGDLRLVHAASLTSSRRPPLTAAAAEPTLIR